MHVTVGLYKAVKNNRESFQTLDTNQNHLHWLSDSFIPSADHIETKKEVTIFQNKRWLVVFTSNSF